MKKTLLAVALCLVMLFAFAACGENQPSAKYTMDDGTYQGTGNQIKFHNGQGPSTKLSITVKDNKITKIEFTKVPTTSAFGLWNGGGADYDNPTKALTADAQAWLDKFKTMTLDEIMEVKANDPVNSADHYDGGSLEGMDVFTGATATSVCVVRAVQNAIRDNCK